MRVEIQEIFRLFGHYPMHLRVNALHCLLSVGNDLRGNMTTGHISILYIYFDIAEEDVRMVVDVVVDEIFSEVAQQ